MSASARTYVDVTPRLFRADDLAVMPTDLPSGTVDYELDNGRLLTMVPPGSAHGSVQAKVTTELVIQGERKGHGKAWSEVGIILWRDPDRVVGADAAFVTSQSLPVQESQEGYLTTIPELVIEIRSKNDTPEYLTRKAQDYLTAGVQVVVVIDPKSRTADILRPNSAPLSLSDSDAFPIEDIIPGFRLRLEQILENEQGSAG